MHQRAECTSEIGRSPCHSLSVTLMTKQKGHKIIIKTFFSPVKLLPSKLVLLLYYIDLSHIHNPLHCCFVAM